MNLSAQRRLAARALKCGENRVFMDPFMSSEISTAITMRDINGLINSGVIKKRYATGISRSRAKMIHEQKKKGRRSGPGTRKGVGSAHQDPKETWITHIRSIRAFLKKLRDKQIIDTAVYQTYYALAKGGNFKNTGQLKRYMQDKGVLKKEKAQKSKK
ncbi:MAG: 50S ribosomal protein L19e [Candidatus Lokiarchaeota archaeon]|nr:50S ribosomal protein L19e [Candidatus Lokiarchaeota archaeon]